MSALLTLVLAATAPHDATARIAPICAAPDLRQTDAPGRAQLKRLDQLPRGEAYLAVLRKSDGCITPVKAREERGRTDGNR